MGPTLGRPATARTESFTDTLDPEDLCLLC